jgi:hypothetical protein
MVPVVFEISSKKLLAYSKTCHCQDLSFSEMATHYSQKLPVTRDVKGIGDDDHIC